jgi:hypothetical protein
MAFYSVPHIFLLYKLMAFEFSRSSLSFAVGIAIGSGLDD